VRYTVELNCPANSIPESIELDLGELEVGDSMHISNVTLPDGVEPVISDRDFTIATIAAPSVSVEPEEEIDDVEGEEGEEGEATEEAEVDGE
jgi:large subunit ribosomal protein L25